MHSKLKEYIIIVHSLLYSIKLIAKTLSYQAYRAHTISLSFKVRERR